MSTSWHVASEAEIRASEQATWPTSTPVDVQRTAHDVYRVNSGSARDSQGVEVDLTGELIKVLSDTAAQSWVYYTDEVVVSLPGGYTASLKHGTRVAALPENYLELIRDARPRAAGSRSPA